MRLVIKRIAISLAIFLLFGASSCAFAEVVGCLAPISQNNLWVIPIIIASFFLSIVSGLAAFIFTAAAMEEIN